MGDKRYKVSDERTFDTFRKRFKQLIDSRGFNKRETADALNINSTSVSRYFYNRNPDTLVLWRIADYFDVSADWLLGRTDDKYATLTDEEKSLLEKYKLSTSDDRLIIDTLLSKYDKL